MAGEGRSGALKVHDFVKQGKAIPYGVYDLSRDEGWVSVGVDHDTAHFAVNAIRMEPHGPLSLRRYWPPGDHRRCRRQQQSENPAVEVGVAALRESTGLTIRYDPPGNGKWNRIEHRLFSYIAMNWRGNRWSAWPRGQSDRRHDFGERPAGALGDRYPFVPSRGEGDRRDEEHQSLTDEFHGDWNYTIRPTSVSLSTTIICFALATLTVGSQNATDKTRDGKPTPLVARSSSAPNPVCPTFDDCRQ